MRTCCHSDIPAVFSLPGISSSVHSAPSLTSAGPEGSNGCQMVHLHVFGKLPWKLINIMKIVLKKRRFYVVCIMECIFLYNGNISNIYNSGSGLY